MSFSFFYLFIASGRPLIVLIDHLRSRRCVPFKLSRLDLHVSSASLENIDYLRMPNIKNIQDRCDLELEMDVQSHKRELC